MGVTDLSLCFLDKCYFIYHEKSVIHTEFSWWYATMIDRDLHVQRITGLLKRFPVVALLGARQV